MILAIPTMLPTIRDLSSIHLIPVVYIYSGAVALNLTFNILSSTKK